MKIVLILNEFCSIASGISLIQIKYSLEYYSVDGATIIIIILKMP